MNGWNPPGVNNRAEEHWVLYNNCKYLLYSPRDADSSSAVSHRFGSGQVKQLLRCPFAEIKESEFVFPERMCGGADFSGPRMLLYFCLAGDFALEEKELVVDTENFLAFNANGISRVTFQPNFQYRIVTVEVYPEIFRAFTGEYLPDADRPQAVFSTYKLSPALKTLLYQLIHSPCREPVRTVYRQGKLLELLAVYADEILCRQTAPGGYPGLSRQDIASIHEARQFLDQHFVAPPTLAGLSKIICLNEFKLKHGFKQLFGQTVHAYIISKKLELARHLFEEKQLNVGEAAAYIGYANASYFTAVFRKKFGVSPSEYLAQKK
ncbi:Helix-turn-helix, AraC domain-containing protein [uncultured Sporomusa sp.]|uniref:Helix-turn-helix, AraC domain-containing protein n=1 Tax=uncultured Sporomusa sp. TaxID=307249 RepID=A0A212LVE1_9FIRM|nr:AraC family transcriptional regulator [uncultured Sporomusa sp.]SCM81482.1 Helix-turn-helix, AraC domain-containing protein [uncultured Sporomusa sp.]